MTELAHPADATGADHDTRATDRQRIRDILDQRGRVMRMMHPRRPVRQGKGRGADRQCCRQRNHAFANEGTGQREHFTSEAVPGGHRLRRDGNRMTVPIGGAALN